ncbi:MAG: hypothetical protein IPK72_05275 [Candidatus Eisenbacteria bacterium]|nr:hypothetical protein [Candidatus Eisenbacteria bacterium]
MTARRLASTPKAAVRERVKTFYGSVAGMFEAWVNRSDALNTRRSYRRAVMGFVDFLGIRWPEESFRLLGATVVDVRAWREFLDQELDQAPKTLNHLAATQTPPSVAGSNSST